MRSTLLVLALVAAGCRGGGAAAGDDDSGPDAAAPETRPDATPGQRAIQTVFVILMENHNWAAPSYGPVIKGNPSAPYINDTLLPMAAHAEAYRSPPGIHPSEPNYLWLESGSNHGITHDYDASASNSIAGSDHLTALLEAAGISWTSYQEDLPSGVCPLKSAGHYAAKHNPFVFFQDVTDGNKSSSAHCMDHMRPLSALQSDLDAGTVARYVFITPSLCNDMHGGTGCPSGDKVFQGDTWLSHWVPALTASSVYQDGHAAIFITWDENEHGDYPIGMIVVSPHAKAGYAGTVPYTHSSTLRSIEEIFEVSPMLGDAANASSLADLFVDYP